MKITNDIINWITQSGTVLWLFYFALVIAKPFVDGKIKHAKTAQQRESWTLLEQVAMTTVNSLVSADKPGRQKFDEASTQVASYLSDHGIKMNMNVIQSAVQAAYEKSPLTTPTCESTVTQTPDGYTATINGKKVMETKPGKVTLNADHVVFAGKSFIPSDGGSTPAPAPTPAGDPVMDAIAKAPNRANDVKEAN